VSTALDFFKPRSTSRLPPKQKKGTAMKMSRRTVIGVGAALWLGLGTAGYAQDADKVTIALSTTDQDISYEPYGPLPAQLGLFKDQGLDVDVQTAASTGQVIQLLLSGKAQFGQVSPDALLLTADNGDDPLKMVFILVRKMIYSAAVLPDSKIANYGDFKGKTIGYPAYLPSLVSYMDNRMADYGTSTKDTKEVDAGYGVTSMEALKSGTVDAFVAWPGLFAAYENAGYKFRVLPEAEWQSQYYGIGLVARADFIEKNPDVVAKIGRGLAQSSVFLKHNAASVVDTFWKAYPERAPLPGEDKETRHKQELNILSATMNQMRIDSLADDFKWGSQDKETWDRHLALLKKTGQVKTDIDVTKYFTNEFSDKYNDFDRAAIVEKAKSH
jgi:NitT/TauT family transport system substrate-binding protein